MKRHSSTTPEARLGDVTVVIGAGMTTVPAGSYVVPADVVAYLSSGNSIVGGRIIQNSLDGGSPPFVEKDPPEISQKGRKGAGKGSQRTDEKEPARATIRSACIAAEQRYTRSGGNPLHVWEAIWMCTQPAVSPLTLPDWCIPYLHEIANGLLAAEGDGEKLAAFIARQLKFSKIGGNAVKDRASAERATNAALLYDKLRADGMSSEVAYEKVREARGFAEVSSARKLVKRGRAMLRHTPQPR